MLRCREVPRLLAGEEVRSAPWRTRIAVRMHLMICRDCRRYVCELARIGAAVRDLYRPVADVSERDEALVRRILGDSGRSSGQSPNSLAIGSDR